MPQRFDLKYTGADNAEHRPVVIHRAIFGSFERFIAILIEHYAGAFPLWLAPIQAIVLPISDRHLDYAGSVRDQLRAAGLRVDLDDRQEKIGYKIREAQLQKVPYMLVVGRPRERRGHCIRADTYGRRPGASATISSQGAHEIATKVRPQRLTVGAGWPSAGEAAASDQDCRSERPGTAGDQAVIRRPL